MSDPHKTYEIRCPVYGFIELSDWEWEIVNQPAFQRLRRIRQLAWTDYLYPGAMHTRFEHSLGVMHMASLLFDCVVKRSKDLLRDMGYTDDGLGRHRTLVRLAALLHDVGHAPFSHASEDLFPEVEGNEDKFKHEHYSAEIVRLEFADVVKNHPLNKNYDFCAEDIASLFEGSPGVSRALFWQELIHGQLDADRMDYLLRDSYHTGVDYGRYDWRRLIHTVEAIRSPKEEGESLRLGVDKGGWHAAEGLIIARYFMFTQVYFHKTRVAYDYHLREALKCFLSGGKYPPPTSERKLEEFLHWDDWRVLGLLAQGGGGDHGRRLAERDHYRMVIESRETPNNDDLERLQECRKALKDLLVMEEAAENSWYKVGTEDILVAGDVKGKVEPLSSYSSFVAKMAPINQIKLYVKKEDVPQAKKRLSQIEGGDNE